MILLLDPSDDIFRISKDLNTVSKDEIIEALSEIYFVLSGIERELLKKISEIKIVNPLGVNYTVDRESYNKFIKKNVKKSDLLYPLFLKSSIHNLAGIPDSIKLVVSLNEGNNKFIFFDLLLTNGLIWYISLCQNKTGYRSALNDNDDEWTEIMDMERYFSISLALYCRFIGQDVISEIFSNSKKGIREALIQDLINKIETKNLTKHLCLFNEWDWSDQKELISALTNKYKPFEPYFCVKGSSDRLPKSIKGLIIYDFHYLDKEEQIKLLKELFSEDYKERIVIIFSSESVDSREYPQLEIWLSTQGVIGFIESMMAEMIKWGEVIDLKIAEYKKLIDALTVNYEWLEKVSQKYIEQVNKRFNDLVEGSPTFDAVQIDFWYDLKHFELFDIKSVKEWLIQMDKKYFPLVKQSKFVFTPEGNYWYIKVNDNNPADKNEKKKYLINHTKNKAIRYLVYLIKHTTPNNPMSFAKLSKSISKWKTGNEVEVKYATFTESIGDLFKKYDFLKPIEKYLYYDTTGRGCYYQENAEILIDLTAIDIPFVRLKNKK